MMRHIKKFAALLLAAICTMMVLTGCVDKASLYDDTQQIAAGRTAYSATGYQGGYVMGATVLPCVAGHPSCHWPGPLRSWPRCFCDHCAMPPGWLPGPSAAGL